MRIDLAREGERLAEHYRRLPEGELLALDADFDDLTGVAQEALLGELRSRGLTRLRDRPAARAGRPHGHVAQSRNPPVSPPLPGVFPVLPALPSREAGGDEGAQGPGPVRDCGMEDRGVGDDLEEREPVEYTWKTPLAECDSRRQLWQLTETLSRGGDRELGGGAPGAVSAGPGPRRPARGGEGPRRPAHSPRHRRGLHRGRGRARAVSPSRLSCLRGRRPLPRGRQPLQPLALRSLRKGVARGRRGGGDPCRGERPAAGVSRKGRGRLKNGKSRPATGQLLPRENSSNGGKTIRTFWLHSRCGGSGCQE